MKKETNKQSKKLPIKDSTEALQAEINRLRMENEYLKKSMKEYRKNMK